MVNVAKSICACTPGAVSKRTKGGTDAFGRRAATTCRKRAPPIATPRAASSRCNTAAEIPGASCNLASSHPNWLSSREARGCRIAAFPSRTYLRTVLRDAPLSRAIAFSDRPCLPITFNSMTCSSSYITPSVGGPNVAWGVNSNRRGYSGPREARIPAQEKPAFRVMRSQFSERAFRVMRSQFAVGLGWVTLARLREALCPNRDLPCDNFANCFPCTLTKAFPSV